jgi:hypothetical protein
LSALVHRGPLIVDVQRRLLALFSEVIEDAAAAGETRQDVSPSELASYCLHALPAAAQAADVEQVSRVVRVVLDGLGGKARPLQ